MITDETTPTTYHLFDHSYQGGSWNMALIEQVDAQKRRAEKAEAERDSLRRVVNAFCDYRRHVYFCKDCGGGDPCENGDDLYSAALAAVDSVCGKPSGESEGSHGN